MRVQRFLVTAVLALLVTVAGAQTGGQTAPKPAGSPKKSGEIGQLVEIKAKIEAIDLNTRKVTLRTPAGKALEVEAGPEVKRLNELKVGDDVRIQYYESLTLALSSAHDGVPSQSMRSSELRNKEHELPGGIKAHETTITAKVTAVDKEASTVTLLGPEGGSVSLEVDPAALEKIAVGDMVSAVYTEALAVSVERASPP
jgi:Cu/Ag efflux protein CusF